MRNNPVDLFVRIIKTVSEGALQPGTSTTIGELFVDPEIFGPLEFELCLYSLEATLRREIDDSFYEGDIGNIAHFTLADFAGRYLRPKVSDDPLFITRQFMKFAKSARMEHEEMAEPGGN
ncbi:MAG: hypothetical protein HC888_18945 [Candidatus Competibacteraceae bacterium]|nr:hypothetical protein [Candidatus Competibacteraceae bacterium]